MCRMALPGADVRRPGWACWRRWAWALTSLRSHGPSCTAYAGGVQLDVLCNAAGARAGGLLVTLPCTVRGLRHAAAAPALAAGRQQRRLRLYAPAAAVSHQINPANPRFGVVVMPAKAAQPFQSPIADLASLFVFRLEAGGATPTTATRCRSSPVCARRRDYAALGGFFCWPGWFRWSCRRHVLQAVADRLDQPAWCWPVGAGLRADLAARDTQPAGGKTSANAVAGRRNGGRHNGRAGGRRRRPAWPVPLGLPFDQYQRPIRIRQPAVAVGGTGVRAVARSAAPRAASAGKRGSLNILLANRTWRASSPIWRRRTST